MERRCAELKYQIAWILIAGLYRAWGIGRREHSGIGLEVGNAFSPHCHRNRRIRAP